MTRHCRGSLGFQFLLIRSFRRFFSSNGLCEMVESPELPPWVNSLQNENLKLGETEDFVLPTKLDVLGEWTSISKSDFCQTETQTMCNPSINISNSDINTIGYILKAPFESPAAVVQALDGCDVNVSDELVNRTLRRLGNNWISAFGFFTWADGQLGYMHKSNSYDAMVDILGKAKKFDLMWSLIKEMVDMGQLITLTTMANVMRRLARAGRWSESINTFRKIEQFGLIKDTATLNVLLNALCKESSVKRAWGVYMEFKDTIPPDASTFNSLVNGWCKARKIDEALFTLEEMKRSGLKPCAISYTCLVEAYCMEKNFRKVDDILNEMKANGCHPNIVTYTILMHALGKAKEIGQALLIYDKLKNDGCIPDMPFYNSLIYILARAGHLKDAYAIYEEMKKCGFIPDVTTYNTLIAAACDHSSEKNALKFLHEMDKYSCRPNIMTFSRLLKMACNTKAAKLLSYLLDYISRKDISLDLGTYTLLVDKLCKNGKLVHACTLFEEMVMIGFLPRNSSYLMLMEELEKANNQEGKENLRKLMAKAHGMNK